MKYQLQALLLDQNKLSQIATTVLCTQNSHGSKKSHTHSILHVILLLLLLILHHVQEQQLQLLLHIILIY